VGLDEEDRAFALGVVAELTRLTEGAVDAAPGSVRRESAAARVRTRFSALGASAQARVRAMVGAAGARTPVGAAVARPARGRAARAVEPIDLDRALDGQVRRLVRRRLEAARPGLENSARDALRRAGGGRPRAERVSRTQVDLRLASNEGLDTWRREINMSSVEMLEFRWSSQEAEAARGYWELRGPVTPGSEGELIASGHLPDGMPGTAVGGYFAIPLREYLAPKPPQHAAVYHLRVLPVGRARRVAVGVAAGRRALTPVGPASEREAPEGVGAWSPPAIIRYGEEFETPITEFTIENVSVYKRARFYLDWFQMVNDQSGPGDEEFHLSGFIIQHTPQGASVPIRIGPSSFTLDEDDREKHRFGQQASFYLGTPNQTYWPRAFTAVISVMEEDDGGALADWQASMAEIAEEMMHDAAAAELTAFLDEMRERIAEMQAEIAAEVAAEMAALISAIIAGVTREIISAWIAVVVAWIAANIRSGAVDDLYGVRVFGMCLGTNDVRRLADGTAGELFTNGLFARGGHFRGSEQEDGSFRLEMSELQLKGMGGALEGSPTSGVVNLGLHWEFDDRVDV
jgi:hypothetical protein